MSTVSIELSRGVLHAADLRQRLDISPATLMRAIREAGTDVIPIGRGRATRYGLRQTWPTLDTSRFPVFRILETGTARSEGEVFTLVARETVWMPSGKVVRRASDRTRRRASIRIPRTILCGDACRSSTTGAPDRLVRSSHSAGDVAARRGPARQSHRRR